VNPRSSNDVVIAGGGIIGSAVAYFLARDPGFSGTVVVVEPDSSYRYAASALSASSIRQQFSTPINIAISQYGIEFLRDASEILATNDDRPSIGLTESTYLYLATNKGQKILRENIEVQQKFGVPVKSYDPDELRLRFPWLNVSDLVAGSMTESGEGWFDGYQLLMALRKYALAAGVKYIESSVKDINLSRDNQICRIELDDQTQIDCGYLVNAAGTQARSLSAKAGIHIPVYSRKRCVFVFDCKSNIGNCPLVIDPSGLWFRPEGSQFICSIPPKSDPDVEPDDFEVDHKLFEEQIWFLLANRVPDFNAIKVTNYWAGHYDYNTFDQNAFVGPHHQIRNYLFANGFSGHGLQQAPAIGRGISEYIAYGEYRSLDLSPLSYDRFIKGEPLIESNVI
jgi:glycine/D-amino acid oxidase-like deaminating enzyme